LPHGNSRQSNKISVDEVAEGALLFFARPSRLQSYAEFFGHEWRHVGVVVDTGNGLRVASYGRSTCFREDALADIVGNYSRIGVARVFSSTEEITRLRKFCRRFQGLDRREAPYTLSGFLVGPFHLAARRRSPGILRRLAMAMVTAYCRWMATIFASRPAFACSTFVWAAVRNAREVPLRVPLSQHPDDEAAYAAPQTARDDLYARWLCGPTELWQAVSPAQRCELDLGGHDAAVSVEGGELVIDLREMDCATTDAPAVYGELVIDLRVPEGAIVLDMSERSRPFAASLSRRTTL